MAGERVRLARVCASAIGPGAKADAYKNALAAERTATAIMLQVNSATGQRLLRSLVGVQIDCAFPVARPASGNSGDGLTILAAAVIRLSQKISSAFEAGRTGGFAFGG